MTKKIPLTYIALVIAQLACTSSYAQTPPSGCQSATDGNSFMSPLAQTIENSEGQKKELATQYANAFKATGLTLMQSVGIVANLMLESGLNSGIWQGGRIGELRWGDADVINQTGYGLAQWGEARRDALLRTAEEYGLPTSSQCVNLNYLMKELLGDEKETITALRKTTTLEEAVTSFEATFERASEPNLQSRIDIAKKIMGWLCGGAVACDNYAVPSSTVTLGNVETAARDDGGNLPRANDNGYDWHGKQNWRVKGYSGFFQKEADNTVHHYDDNGVEVPNSPPQALDAFMELVSAGSGSGGSMNSPSSNPPPTVTGGTGGIANGALRTLSKTGNKDQDCGQAQAYFSQWLSTYAPQCAVNLNVFMNMAKRDPSGWPAKTIDILYYPGTQACSVGSDHLYMSPSNERITWNIIHDYAFTSWPYNEIGDSGCVVQALRSNPQDKLTSSNKKGAAANVPSGNVPVTKQPTMVAGGYPPNGTGGWGEMDLKIGKDKIVELWPLITGAAQQNNIPARVLAALILQEGRGMTVAQLKNAAGVAQIGKPEIDALRDGISPRDSTPIAKHPELQGDHLSERNQVYGAAAYLRFILDTLSGGDIERSMRYYNGGPNAGGGLNDPVYIENHRTALKIFDSFGIK